MDDGEVVVGVHASGVELQEGMNTSTNKNYCSTCRKNSHCYVKVNRETGEAIIHKNCKSDDCECRCRTHYACRECGYLHPYGFKCNRVETDKKFTQEEDKVFNELMEGWRESKNV